MGTVGAALCAMLAATAVGQALGGELSDILGSKSIMMASVAARGLAGASWRHAGQSNKETARGDLPGIVRQGGDFAIGRTFHRNRSGWEGRNDFGQLHASSVHAIAEGHQGDSCVRGGRIGNELKVAGHGFADA